MSNVRLVHAAPAHCRRLANAMRPIDAAECRAMGKEPLQAVRSSLKASLYAYTAIEEQTGRVLAMMGVCSVGLVTRRGSPWFLGTDDVYMHPRDLLVTGPVIIEHWHETFKEMSNWVAEDNDKAIRMLGRWGATFDGEPTMIGGLRFLPFRFIRPDHEDDRHLGSSRLGGGFHMPDREGFNASTATMPASFNGRTVPS
jgi:hypothetical protein